jgi:hypothetical protein
MAAVFASLSRIMQELLQQIDSDYYLAALLLVVRTELERLREGHSALLDAKRQSKTTFRTMLDK